MDIKFTSTEEAKSNAEVLLTSATEFSTSASDLDGAESKLLLNWEGESTDILDIQTRMSALIRYYNQVIVPALNLLGKGINAFAENIEQISAQTADGSVEGAGSDQAADAGEAAAGAAETEDTGKSFWERRGEDFADDWDYSKVDGVFSAVGATVGGVVKTAGSIVNTVADGIGSLFGWIFN